MTSGELALVEQGSLCSAYANARGRGQGARLIDAEVNRRGIGCEVELARAVSDCSSLAIVRSEVVQRGTIYTVRNNGARPRYFRAVNNNIVSTLQTVGPGQTVTFGVEASPALAALGGAVALRQNTAGVRLQECTVPW